MAWNFNSEQKQNMEVLQTRIVKLNKKRGKVKKYKKAKLGMEKNPGE